MFDNVNGVELTVFVILFVVVSGMGFFAARWRRAPDLEHLDEWGLGGRNFGGWITWFLLGGDLYTAYTFVAVPALMFGAGAAGFFAVPYTVVIYPLVFLVVIRLWSVSHVRGFVTPADFVRARFDSPTMALLVAITGIVATMPYIALQLVGIEAILKAMGVNGDLPLIVPLYNQVDPTIGGWPRFYWLQLLFVALGVATTVLVYRMTRRTKTEQTAARDAIARDAAAKRGEG